MHTEIIPGDIVEIETGINRERETVTVHRVHTYDTGDRSIRYSYPCNPRGIDWSGFIPKKGYVKLVARGIGAWREAPVSLLPA